MKKSPVRKSYGYDTLQPGQVLRSSHLRHQAPPYMQSRQRSKRAKDGTICREGCTVIFYKWPLSRHFVNCFWISEPVLVRTKCLVSVCSTYRLSLPCMRLDHDSCQVMKFVYMRPTCSVGIQNMRLKLELNLLKQLVFILLCLYLICAQYVFEIFGSTRDQTRLMLFYLHTDVIDVILKH